MMCICFNILCDIKIISNWKKSVKSQRSPLSQACFRKSLSHQKIMNGAGKYCNTITQIKHQHAGAEYSHTILIIPHVSWLTLACYPSQCGWDYVPALSITGGHLHNYSRGEEDLLCIKLKRLHIRKAHMSAVEFDSDPRLGGNETGGRGVSQPLASVNCMSHIILAGTVNWKRSRGFAVLMSFQWTRVILWTPEEPLLSPTFTDPSVRAKLFILKRFVVVANYCLIFCFWWHQLGG